MIRFRRFLQRGLDQPISRHPRLSLSDLDDNGSEFPDHGLPNSMTDHTDFAPAHACCHVSGAFWV